MIIFIITFPIIMLLLSFFAKRELDAFFNTLLELARSGSLLSYLVFGSVLYMFAFLPIPGLTYFIVMMSYMMADLLKAFLLTALGTWSGS